MTGVPLLDLKAQHASIRDSVLEAIDAVIERQGFIMGEEVGRLEEAVAELCGTAHGIGCASGTDALLLPLRALDMVPGDEVITTPFTFFATAGAIHNAGGKPVFVDIDPTDFNIDTDAVSTAVTDRTRAIIPVHLFGQMARLEALIPIGEERGLWIIEDAAQSIGSRRLIEGEWKRAGEVGKVGTLSFFPSKNLGCWGDGGMIVTDDEQLATRLRRLRTHGGAKMYSHDEVGYNSRLDTLQAAVLLAKLPHLAGWSAARRANAAVYWDALEDVAEVQLPVVAEGNEHIYHQFTIRALDRDGLQAHLREKGIGNAVYYPRPLHLQPCFADLGYREGSFPLSEQASREVVSLPVYPELTRDQLHIVCDAIREFYR